LPIEKLKTLEKGDMKMERLKDGTPMWLPLVALVLSGIVGFLIGFLVFG